MSKQSRYVRNSISAAFLISAFVVAGHAAVHEVDQVGLTFVPADITVLPGDTVRWNWGGGGHTVTSGADCVYDGTHFDAPLNSTNTTFEYVIPNDIAVSEIPYFCRPHCGIGMVGTITIEEPADPINFVITLDGDQAGFDTPARGTGTATLNPDTLEFAWDVSFMDLAGVESAAHFHGPARPCEGAGVQVGVGTGNPKVGSATITQAQADQLLAGLWYLNIHSDANPSGEIRGQVYPAPLADPIPDPIAQGSLEVGLTPLATGMTAPNWAASAPGVAGKLIVSDQVGILWSVDMLNGTKSVFADLSSLLIPLGIGGPGTYDERGFLGFAFHPDYASNGKLYTYTSQPAGIVPADFSTIPLGGSANHQSVVTEWQVANPADPDTTVDPNTARELMRIDQPQFNHNAGALAFGPDNMLYIALGDGGSGDDQPLFGHGCLGNGTDTDTILGNILRVDPDGSNAANGQYGVPGDNPFVGLAGLDEIYASGLRNPFRCSFDSMTGDFYVADVGQNDVEELNLVTAGGDYGWRWKEGSFFFAFNGYLGGYVTDMPLDVPAGLIDPIAEYDHDEGISIIGGFVYRGDNVPGLNGTYVFGDFARTFANDGRLLYLGGGNEILEAQISNQADVGRFLLGFGQDSAGEMYLLVNQTGIPAQQTGMVLRLVQKRCAGDTDCDGDIDFDDITPFVTSIGDDGTAWTAQYVAANGELPPCDFLNADMDNDGDVDFDDISPFVNAIGTSCE
jgi:glucose/arabinose dehydrogenase/plastocyanin